MDSQELNPMEGVQEEINVAEQTEQAAEVINSQRIYATKEEVLQRATEIAQGEEEPQKDEIDHLKAAFYKLSSAARDAALREYLEAGGDPMAYQLVPDEVEIAFNAQMSLIKERRAKALQEQEAEREENLKRKLEIIEKIKTMVTSPEEANNSYQEFKALQQEWRDIKAVPPQQASEIWRTYQLYVEQFYDLLKLNHEAREYDFKKNLEMKQQLTERAEALAEVEDVVKAHQEMQAIYNEYRQVGPVAKDLREEVWNRFKAAYTAVNKRHQDHFDALRQNEEENLQKKTALCEQAEALNGKEHKSMSEWDATTKELIALQAEWKTIGFAPKKMNVEIFERFRAVCDDFFTRKAAYFKEVKDAYAANAEKKRALIEKAKELQDSTEWKSTADKLMALQKEWKTIGATPKKIGDQLWEEFIGACNHFFEARKAQHADQHAEENANLEAKKSIIEKLAALAQALKEKVEELPAELLGEAKNAQEALKALQDEYAGIGHVPFREKDKLYEAYREAVNAIRKELNLDNSRRQLNNFKNRIKSAAQEGEGGLDTERARLVRQRDAMMADLQTYENNIGFLSASSKKGNSLIDEMNRKVQKLKDDIALVKEKIKAIDAAQ